MKIKTIHVFGDSFHDTGNLKKITEGKFPSDLYFQGRFSNGPLYFEYLAESISKNLEEPVIIKNYAFGWAMTVYPNSLDPKILSLESQIKDKMFDSDDLVLIYCGVCNYTFFIDTDKFPYIHFKRINSVARDLEVCVNRLITQGAKNIIIFNISNIGVFPMAKNLGRICETYFKNVPVFKMFSFLGIDIWRKMGSFYERYLYPYYLKSIQKNNRRIGVFCSNFDKKRLKVEVFDSYKFITDVINSPELFGFKHSNKST